MRAIHPYMGALRRSQIERAIASWRGHRARWQKPAARCAAGDCPRAGARRGLCERQNDRWWTDSRRGGATNFGPVESPAHAFGPLDEGKERNGACAAAWLTGLLEGEGTFSVNRQSAEIAYPVMKVEMCDEGVVARVARLVGAPNVWRREARKEGWNPTYSAAVTGPQAAVWMRQLRDSMGTRRRAAIDAALAAYHPVYLVDPPASCVVPGCSEPHRGRGLCHKHYMMWSRDKKNGRVARITPLR